jgi:peptide/nickel transport system permease protein
VLAYIVRRLLHAIPVLLGVTLITFLLFNVVCPNPATVLVGTKGGTSAEIQARIDKESKRLGTDQPLTTQYVRFLEDLVHWDFGTSWKLQKDRPVLEILKDGVGPSLTLAVPAFLIQLLLSVCLALFCAYYRNSVADVTTVIVTVAMMSVPALSYILFGQYFLAHEWNMFPVFGYQPGLAGMASLALPILIWVALALGGEVRFYRTVMLEEMRKDYVRTAAAKGLATRRILFKHVLKNGMIPLITRVIVTIPFLMLGSLLIERFFGIPGLGSVTIDAVNMDDLPVIKAMVVISALLLVVFNLITDICYALVDPRVRLK